MSTKTEIEKAAARTAARYDEQHHTQYQQVPLTSRSNLKDEIGLLLWFLCSPINQRQRAAGYRLIEVLYGQYISARAGEVRE